MNSQQIKCFLATAQCLNFTEAARQTYISQPALSKQITLLERELGILLFARTSHSVELTPSGKIMFEEFTRLNQLLDAAVGKAKDASKGKIGSLNIGCLEVLDSNEFLPKAIHMFIGQHPNVNLNFECKSFKALISSLDTRQIDIAITFSFEVDNNPHLRSFSIAEIPGCIVMSKSHPLASRKTVRLKELQKEPFIIISESESLGGNNSFVSLCGENGFTPNIIKQVPNLESAMLCLEVGMGLSILSRYNRLYGNPSLRFVDIEGNPKIAIVAAWKHDNLNPAITPFLSVLQKSTISP